MDTSLQVPSKETINQLQKLLLAWFKSNQRHFPWRQTSDPYFILIAEKLLQQTSARELVKDAYYSILDRYPSPSALANAKVEDVKQMILPLGFHYRAAELILMAKALIEKYNGVIPNSLNELRALPGVGNYIARAVMSFAFGQHFAVVDINVARVYHRIFDLPPKILKNPANEKQLLKLATELLPIGKSRDYNLALLDLSAQICVKKKPKCEICPVRRLCSYGNQVKLDHNTHVSLL